MKTSKKQRPPRREKIRWTVTCFDCGNPITVSGKLEVDCMKCGTVYTLILHEKDQTIM